jgi:hypothetical protein
LNAVIGPASDDLPLNMQLKFAQHIPGVSKQVALFTPHKTEEHASSMLSSLLVT